MAFSDLTSQQQQEYYTLFTTIGLPQAEGIEQYDEQNP